jgi:chromosome partitioning protein
LSDQGKGIALIDADPQRSAAASGQPGNLRFPIYEMALADDSVTSWGKRIASVQTEWIVIDTAPSERDVGASVAISSMIVVPCTPSGLDLESTWQALGIVAAVRERRRAPLSVVLVPNRVDARTLEGRQIVSELASLGEAVWPPIGSRSAFLRAFSAGRSVGDAAPGDPAHVEISNLCDLIERLRLERPVEKPSFGFPA